MSTKRDFPKEIYIYICDHGNDGPIFSATTSLRDIDDADELVGIYDQKAVKHLTVTRELV